MTASQAYDFLTAKYGSIGELEPLGGGFWSSAYSFSHGDQELVARFGPRKDWFEADRAASAFNSRDLPVPRLFNVGDAFEGAYAVSERRYGMFLEDIRPDQRTSAGSMLGSLLGALFRVPKTPDLAVGWHWASPRPELTWKDWLQDPTSQRPGWRSKLATRPELARILRASESRITQLIDACPERRDLVHGDLLYRNVLVADDATQPTAVFSWKCSVRGDFLFDVAWCTFWSSWYEGVAAADPWSQVQREHTIRADAEAWIDAPARHHCYELQIGVTHLGWNIWLDDSKELKRVADRLDSVLERGPLKD